MSVTDERGICDEKSQSGPQNVYVDFCTYIEMKQRRTKSEHSGSPKQFYVTNSQLKPDCAVLSR
jgi:hypothetical protein